MKILIIDDEEDLLTYFAALLQDHGFDTVAAATGSQGVMLARSESPDLIALDIAMPDQTGVKTYHQLKQDPRLRKIPVIVITATDAPLNLFAGKNDGFAGPEGFFSKPLKPKDLLDKVTALLHTQGEKP